MTSVSLWLLILVTSLAVYRLARVTSGGDRIFRTQVEAAQEWAERRWAAKHPEDVDAASQEWQSQLAYFIGCPYCQSVWIAGVTVAALDIWFVDVALPGLVAVAVAGAAALMTSFEHLGDDG